MPNGTPPPTELIPWVRYQLQYVTNYVSGGKCDCFLSRAAAEGVEAEHAHSPICNTQIEARVEATERILKRAEVAEASLTGARFLLSESQGRTADELIQTDLFYVSAMARYTAVMQIVQDVAWAYRNRPGYQEGWKPQ